MLFSVGKGLTGINVVSYERIDKWLQFAQVYEDGSSMASGSLNDLVGPNAMPGSPLNSNNSGIADLPVF